MEKRAYRRQLILFFVLISAAALGNGLSDGVYTNYYHDAYHITAAQRAFIEFPREMPGLLCMVVIAFLAPLGDLRAALIAQVLACVGLVFLGLLTPAFGVMLVFLFVNSMGMHLFMPLQDSIGMAIAEPGRVGVRMGQYASVRTAVGMVAGLIAFFGFRFGYFSFTTPVKTIFMYGAGVFAFAIAVSLMLVRGNAVKGASSARKVRFVFRKRYKYYYLLTILHGVQKQIAYVFGSWLIVDMLKQPADMMSLLIIGASFLGIFFVHYIGKWMDRFGVKNMMYVDALTFIVIYALYGFVVWGIVDHLLPAMGWPVMVIFGIFILDRLSMQIGIVNSVYLRGIADDKREVTAVLSTGISLDHVVSIIAAQLSALVWMYLGPQWVFFFAAILSLGNLYAAWRIVPGVDMDVAPEAVAAAEVSALPEDATVALELPAMEGGVTVAAEDAATAP